MAGENKSECKPPLSAGTGTTKGTAFLVIPAQAGSSTAELVM
jgi:hypothetical protein